MTAPTQATARKQGLLLDLAAITAQGPRKENQDAFSIADFEETGTVAVADGMGGERGGRMAADTALRALQDAGPIHSLDAARFAVRDADRAVALAAEEDVAERGGMGCALALLALAPDRGGLPGWVGAFAGDVRILSRAPDGTVRLESRDHTPAFARWEAGEIGLDEVTEAEGANRLQRAVGRGGEAEAVWIPARPGWSYLLASDGVSKATRLEELGDALAAESAAEACEQIRRKVEERGPDDNYTAVVVRVAGGDATEPIPAAPRLFSPEASMIRPRRSPWGAAALVVALLALGAAGWALWSGMEARAEAAPLLEMERLESRIESLELRLPADTVAPAAAADSLIARPFPAPGTLLPNSNRP
ncbi:MAG: protein phosphatase 2C domain-containing protein [Gemmatimonadota bacterium]|nr:protein phosphatase 2C domain-containing protein [Gemmatimonadota bacterium]